MSLLSRRVWAGLLALGVSWMPAFAAGPSQALPGAVAAALARAQVPADALVVEVAEVGARRAAARLSHRADEPVNPASVKLFTTYAALDLLGPAYTWTTTVHAEGPVRDGVLEGSLYLRAQGDPKLVMERLWLLLRRVRQLGIVEVRGDLVLDRSAFELPVAHPGDFDGEPLRPYNVLPDALLVNHKSLMLSFVPDTERGVARVVADPPLHGMAVEDAVPLDFTAACGDWRAALRVDLAEAGRLRFRGAYPARCGELTWAMASPDPWAYNAQAVLGMWRELGGQVGGLVREGRVPPGLPALASQASPPLAEVVRDINKYSSNPMARQLYLTLGLELGGAGTPQAARQVVSQWLRERLGPDADAVVLDNGSGLSREARASAHALGRLLQSAWAGPVMPELMASLPVTGQDGTMRRTRLAAGTAHLKTGTLRDVTGIAGYVLADSGRRYVLVAIVNHPNAGAARPVLASLIDWTARDQAREGRAPGPR